MRLGAEIIINATTNRYLEIGDRFEFKTQNHEKKFWNGDVGKREQIAVESFRSRDVGEYDVRIFEDA